MFKKMDHVAISVKDMERAIRFYGDVIGMEKGIDRVFEKPMATILGIEKAKVRIVHMKLGDSVVELFDYMIPSGREPKPGHQQCDFGLIHIGFMVEDFENTYKHLLDHGVEFLGNPVEIRPGVMVAYFRGVEYEICEIREISSR